MKKMSEEEINEEEILIQLDVTKSEFRKSVFEIYTLVNKYSETDDDKITFTDITLDILKTKMSEKLKIFHTLKFLRLLENRKLKNKLIDASYLLGAFKKWSDED